MEDSITKFANVRAIFILIEDSDCGTESEKLDFFNHPAAVVLSDWERMQSFLLMSLL